MRFIIDAQLPERLKYWLLDRGHEAIHTNDLPQKHTTGNIINNELIRLFELNFNTIENYFNSGSSIIEFNNQAITVHS